MQIYRFVELNDSGVVDRVHEVRLATDDQARTHAAGMGGGSPIEIWRGNVRLARLPASHKRVA